MAWTKDKPTEPGRYWFYGDPFWGSMNQTPDLFKPEYYIVKVDQCKNDMFFVVDGNFMYKGHGLWFDEPINEPMELPEVRLPARNG